MDITQDEFNRMFGVPSEEPRPPKERTAFRFETIPETCPWFSTAIRPGGGVSITFTLKVIVTGGAPTAIVPISTCTEVSPAVFPVMTAP